MDANKATTIIFDFDHTLFDAIKFRKIISLFFERNNIPADIADSTFRSAYNSSYNYGFLEQLNMLKKIGYAIPNKEIDSFFNQSLKHILKGPVEETLKKLKDRGHRLILLTKGLEYFQRFKVRQSGLEAYFGHNIYVCKDKKEEAIKSIPAKGRTYFVNDHADEIEAVAKVYPEMNFIYVKGPKTAHDRFIKHEHIPTIDDISSLPFLIKKV